MNRNIYIGLIVIIIIILIGVFAFAGKSPEMSEMEDGTATSTDNQSATSTDSTDTGASTTSATTYTMSDVATHNNAQSCWTVVSGEVYDLTAWIGKHPGGPGAIMSLCGKDGTSAFTGQHGGQDRPEQTLASFKIGVLAQ